MAGRFDVTARINATLGNTRPVVTALKRRLQGIRANIGITFDRTAIRNVGLLNRQLRTLNNTLSTTTSLAASAASNLRGVGAAGRAASKALGNTASASAKTTAQMQAMGKSTQQATTFMHDLGKAGALAIKRYAGFTIATGVVFGFVRAISDAVAESIKFDRELVRVAQVSKSSMASLRSLNSEITRLATSFGASSTELIEVSRILKQTGLSVKETEQALEALAKSSLAPTFGNMTRTAEGAIAAMRQFDIGAKDLEKTLGSINAVAGQFAVESDDIIAAIRRAGGVFAASSKGVSDGTDALNEFIATFTSVRATTRESAESIATGLRTIFTRIQRESTVRQLREFGIELRDLEGKFVGPFEAVNRLSVALRKLDPRDARFIQITESLGGFRQIGKVIPAIQQMETRMDALKSAMEGQNSLAEDTMTAQQAMAVQISKVREEFLALIREISQTDTFKTMLKLILDTTSGLIGLAKAVKPILPMLAILGAVKVGFGAAQFTRGFFGGIKSGGGAGAFGERLAGGTGEASRTAAAASQKANTIALGKNTIALNTLTRAVMRLATLGSGGIPPIRRFHGGGLVPGGKGTHDDYPATLQEGEYVIRRRAVDKIGVDNLQRMNAAGGGVVTGYPQGGKTLTNAQLLAAPVGTLTPAQKSARKQLKAQQKATQTKAEMKKAAKESRRFGAVSIFPYGGRPPVQWKDSKYGNLIMYRSGLGVDDANRGQKKLNKAMTRGVTDVAQGFATSLNTLGRPVAFDRGRVGPALEKAGVAQIQGTMFEAALGAIGAPFESKGATNAPIDFPQGIGAASSLFDGVPGNIPTDATRTLGSWTGKGGLKYSGKGLSDMKAQIRRHLDERSAKKNRGGRVGFAGGGEVDALLTRGEYVMSKDAVKRYGLAAMERLNNADKFHDGGPVGFAGGGFVGAGGKLERAMDRLVAAVVRTSQKLGATPIRSMQIGGGGAAMAVRSRLLGEGQNVTDANRTASKAVSDVTKALTAQSKDVKLLSRAMRRYEKAVANGMKHEDAKAAAMQRLTRLTNAQARGRVGGGFGRRLGGMAQNFGTHAGFVALMAGGMLSSQAQGKSPGSAMMFGGAGGALAGAGTGAALGMMAGPYGAAAGAIGGLILGGVSGGVQAKQAAESAAAMLALEDASKDLVKAFKSMSGDITRMDKEFNNFNQALGQQASAIAGEQAGIIGGMGQALGLGDNFQFAAGASQLNANNLMRFATGFDVFDEKGAFQTPEFVGMTREALMLNAMLGGPAVMGAATLAMPFLPDSLFADSGDVIERDETAFEKQRRERGKRLQQFAGEQAPQLQNSLIKAVEGSMGRPGGPIASVAELFKGREESAVTMAAALNPDDAVNLGELLHQAHTQTKEPVETAVARVHQLAIAQLEANAAFKEAVITIPSLTAAFIATTVASRSLVEDLLDTTAGLNRAKQAFGAFGANVSARAGEAGGTFAATNIVSQLENPFTNPRAFGPAAFGKVTDSLFGKDSRAAKTVRTAKVLQDELPAAMLEAAQANPLNESETMGDRLVALMSDKLSDAPKEVRDAIIAKIQEFGPKSGQEKISGMGIAERLRFTDELSSAIKGLEVYQKAIEMGKSAWEAATAQMDAWGKSADAVAQANEESAKIIRQSAMLRSGLDVRRAEFMGRRVSVAQRMAGFRGHIGAMSGVAPTSEAIAANLRSLRDRRDALVAKGAEGGSEATKGRLTALADLRVQLKNNYDALREIATNTGEINAIEKEMAQRQREDALANKTIDQLAMGGFKERMELNRRAGLGALILSGRGGGLSDKNFAEGIKAIRELLPLFKKMAPERFEMMRDVARGATRKRALGRVGPVFGGVLESALLGPKEREHLEAEMAMAADKMGVASAALAEFAKDAALAAKELAEAGDLKASTIMANALTHMNVAGSVGIMKVEGKHGSPKVVDASAGPPGGVFAGRGLGRSKGGILPGFGGGDRIPLLAEGGEFVVNKDATARNRGLLEMLNSNRFANGGFVSFAEWKKKRDAERARRKGMSSAQRLAEAREFVGANRTVNRGLIEDKLSDIKGRSSGFETSTRMTRLSRRPNFFTGLRESQERADAARQQARERLRTDRIAHRRRIAAARHKDIDAIIGRMELLGGAKRATLYGGLEAGKGVLRKALGRSAGPQAMIDAPLAEPGAGLGLQPSVSPVADAPTAPKQRGSAFSRARARFLKAQKERRRMVAAKKESRRRAGVWFNNRGGPPAVTEWDTTPIGGVPVAGADFFGAGSTTSPGSFVAPPGLNAFTGVDLPGAMADFRNTPAYKAGPASFDAIDNKVRSAVAGGRLRTATADRAGRDRARAGGGPTGAGGAITNVDILNTTLENLGKITTVWSTNVKALIDMPKEWEHTHTHEPITINVNGMEGLAKMREAMVEVVKAEVTEALNDWTAKVSDKVDLKEGAV